MRPTDPRLRAPLAAARSALVTVLLAGTATSLLVVLHAFALAALVVAVVQGQALLGPAALLVGAVVLRALSSGIGDLAAARAATRVSARLRRDLADAVVSGRTREVPGGELAALATRGVGAAEPYVTRYLPAVALAALLPGLTVLAIATQDLLSAVIVLATVGLVPLFGALIGLATRDRAEGQWRAMASLSGHFVDVVRGLPTLVAFGRAEAQSRSIRATAERYRRATMATLRIAFASAAVLELVATLSVAVVAVVVGTRLAAGGMDLRTALVVLLLAPEAYWPLRRVGAEFHAAAEGVATFERLAELTAPAGEAGSVAAGDQISVHGLGYTYPGREVPAVAPLTAEFRSGEITAVTGPSGCGKSTLLALLAGLLDPTSGSVEAGGGPATEPSWQAQVAWVPQRPAFLDASVAENLRIAAPSATDEELWAALRQVALAERVLDAGGLGVGLGEDGSRFSAGERARLALARAVLARRPWVFLDEPTAHLDPITQRVMLDVIGDLARTSGVVVVAHEPVVVAFADRTVELQAPPAVDPVRRSSPVGERAVPVPPSAADLPAPRMGFALSTVLGVLASTSGVALTATAGWLIVKAAEHPPVLTMLVAIVGVRAFGLGRPVFRYAERLRSHDAALRLLAARRVAVYETVTPLTPGRLGTRRGDLLASVVEDVDAVVDRELRFRLPLRTYAAVLLLAAAIATALLPGAGAVLAATSAGGAAVAYLVARVGSTTAERRGVALRAELSERFVTAAEVATELQMWQAGAAVRAPVAALGERLGRTTRRAATAGAAARVALQLAALAGVLGTAAVGSRALEAGAISAPALALLLLLPVALAEVAIGVVDAGSIAGRIQAAEARLAALEALTPAVAEPDVAAPDPGSVSMALAGVALGWGGRPVLTGLDLTLRPGEHLAVLGPSGCGKSTLAAALIRFIDPCAGQVQLGGTPLTDLALGTVRRTVGYVDDDPHVFATSLAENVRLARPGASDAEVRAALTAAHLDAWVDSLPAGLDTWLGDGHSQVSGGERARLGLARSLLLDQPVLVLDEPIAHLDTVTAHRVTEDLLAAGADRTVVWITHSELGLDRVDRVLDLGRTSPTRPDVGAGVPARSGETVTG